MLYNVLVKTFIFLSQAFEEAGRVEPGNVQVAHNFCVIMVKRQQYMKAKECLEELANQTDEEFVTVNLNKLNELIEKKQAEGDPLTWKGLDNPIGDQRFLFNFIQCHNVPQKIFSQFRFVSCVGLERQGKNICEQLEGTLKLFYQKKTGFVSHDIRFLFLLGRVNV